MTSASHLLRHLLMRLIASLGVIVLHIEEVVRTSLNFNRRSAILVTLPLSYGSPDSYRSLSRCPDRPGHRLAVVQ